MLQNVGKRESALTDQQFFIALYTLCTLLPMTDPLPPPPKKKLKKKNVNGFLHDEGRLKSRSA